MEENKNTITTSCGFTYEIDNDVLDDMEIFDDLIMMDDPEVNQAQRMAASTRVFRRLIGEDQRKKLDAYLKEKDGKVRISAYQREVMEIFSKVNEDKKK